MMKNMFEPSRARPRYTSRCSLSEACSDELSSSLVEMSIDLALVSSSETSSALFSRMLPSLFASSSSSDFSKPTSCTLSSSSCRSTSDLRSSSSGCSDEIVSESSWSSSPECVIEKFTFPISAAVSGVMAGSGLRVTRYMRKSSW